MPPNEVDFTIHHFPVKTLERLKTLAEENDLTVEELLLQQATQLAEQDQLTPGQRFVLKWGGAFQMPDQETIDNDPRLQAILER